MKQHFTALLIGCFAMSAPYSGAQITNVTWATGASGSWSTPSNWTPNGIPNENNNVFVTNEGGASISLASNSAAANLYMQRDSAFTFDRFSGDGGQILTISGNLETNTQTLLFRRIGFTVNGEFLVNGVVNLGDNTTTTVTTSRIFSVDAATTALSSAGVISVRGIAPGATINFGNLSMVVGSVLNLTSGSSATNGSDPLIENVINVDSLNGTGTVRANKTVGDSLAALVVNGAANSNFSGQILNGGTGVQVVRLEKNGTAELILSGNNNFSGGTTLNAGILTAGHNSALGTQGVVLAGTEEAVLQIQSGVTLANNIRYSNTHSDSAIRKTVAVAENITTGTSGTLRSDLIGGVDTFAALLAGQNTGVSALALEMAFSVSATAANDSLRISDVFALSGTNTETFVLQLSTGIVQGEPFYLGWLDNGVWKLAVDGNSAVGMLGGEYAETSWSQFLADNGPFDAISMLGAYGYDTQSGSAWAVLDHNSSFALAAVPEPGAVVLFGFSLVLTTLIRRAKYHE